MPREVSLERLIKDAERVLNNPFWIPEIETNKLYARLHDDHDGTRKGSIGINFSIDGDAWVNIDPSETIGSLRFRTFYGGGQSPRVRNALMMLALAIKLDNEENPQR